jgi:hypothetical protein
MTFLLIIAGKIYVTLQPTTVDISCANFLPTFMDKSMLFFWQ